jgi:hypothetical protein
MPELTFQLARDPFVDTVVPHHMNGGVGLGVDTAPDHVDMLTILLPVQDDEPRQAMKPKPFFQEVGRLPYLVF